MKKYLGIIVMISMIVILAALAFKPAEPPGKGYSFGSRTDLSLTYAASIDVTLQNTLTVVDLNLGGNVTLNLSASSKTLIGDRVLFVITADTTDSKDTVTWGTNFTAPVSYIDSIKVKTFEFFYDGTDFKAIGTPLQLSSLEPYQFYRQDPHQAYYTNLYNTQKRKHFDYQQRCQMVRFDFYHSAAG